MLDYSQFGEQAHILKFFEERGREKGRFLDIGAHDGISCSNTLRLAELGWGGMLVEPSPIAFTKLITTYAKRDDIEFVCAAAVAQGSRGRLIPFYEGGGSFVGTTDEKHRDAWQGKQHVQYVRMWTHPIEIGDLLALHGLPQHFISIDTEGTNNQLLDSLLHRFGRGLKMLFGTELICVERDPGFEDVLKRCDDVVEVYAETSANTLLAVK